MKESLFNKVAYNRYKSKAEKYTKDKRKASALINKASAKSKKNKASLKGIWDSLVTMTQMLKAWVTGEYKQIPYRTLVLLFVGILYFVTPIDIIPDFIIGVGMLDDVAVIGFIIKGIQKDLDRYTFWKKEKENTVYTIDYSNIQQ